MAFLLFWPPWPGYPHRVARSVVCSVVRAVVRLLPGLMLGWLAGCAMAPAAQSPSPAPLLHDALFGAPARPAGADTVFSVDEAMRAHLRQVLPAGLREAQRPAALAASLLPEQGLTLRYDTSRTRNAREAFAERAGNCLSLVVMTAALAQEAGLAVAFQQAQASEVISHAHNLVLVSGHVNVVLGTHRPQPELPGAALARRAQHLQIDFLPADELRGLRLVPIDEKRVLAMFMNNRAAEALLAQQLPEAYAWVREAVRHDAAYWPAYNTLGVVYQRAGHVAEATAAFAHAITHDAQNRAARANLEQLLLARTADARSTPPERARYAGKLDALRATPMP